MPMNPAQQRNSAPAVIRSASILAAILITFTWSSIFPGAFGQSPSTGQKFVAGDDTPTALTGPYQTWLDQDVRWIIAPDERSAYTGLKTNPERLQFIENFWEQRNPDPGSSENTFKEEHYRRIVYANEHFAAGRPGWKSDRGRIYIVYGKPDSIEAHPYNDNSMADPFEVWHYNTIHPNRPHPGRATHNIDFRFIDPCRCGEYKLTSMLP